MGKCIKKKALSILFSKKQKYFDHFGDSRILPHFTKMATKWTRINLQSIVIPIWNPENKGYKIGFEKRCWGQQEWPENSLENFRILFADSVFDFFDSKNNRNKV